MEVFCIKRTRQIHLWIGLICSVFILVQAVTGLLLMEPWLIGSSKEGVPGQRGNSPQAIGSVQEQATASGTDTGESATTDNFPAQGTDGSDPATFEGGGPGGQRGQMGGEGGGNVGFIKNLHAGKIGNTDIGWLIDLGAIGLIILTVTGITMSIKILKAQRVRRGKIKAPLQG